MSNARFLCYNSNQGNTKFLQQCLPDAEFVFTGLNDKPAFLDDEVTLCCMYSCSEKNQEIILTRMLKWKDEINQAIASGNTMFLLLGNAMELFGSYIEREDGTKVDTLQSFDIPSIVAFFFILLGFAGRNFFKIFNWGLKILSHKKSFTFLYIVL